MIAGTGHRPDKLGGYSEAAQANLVAFACATVAARRPSVIISGMALGWDQALAAAAVIEGVPFHAYLPCDGMDAVWGPSTRARYAKLLGGAAKVVVVSPGAYAAWKMQARNVAMVDAVKKGGELWALWNGTPGGTKNTVDYARKVGAQIVDLWPAFRSPAPSPATR